MAGRRGTPIEEMIRLDLKQTKARLEKMSAAMLIVISALESMDGTVAQALVPRMRRAMVDGTVDLAASRAQAEYVKRVVRPAPQKKERAKAKKEA